MKISRVSHENMAPDWVFDNQEAIAPDSDILTEEEIERIDRINVAESLSEDELVIERDEIERCAETGSVYHYNHEWSNEARTDLKEYASVCGLDSSKFKSVDADTIESIRIQAAEANVVKTAETEPNKKGLKINDPFKLDELGDVSHLEKTEWEDIKRQEDLRDAPSMMSHAIRGIRGGEDYDTPREVGTAIGQNSIIDSNAIGDLFESDAEDTGARLKRENEKKAEQRKANHEEWQNEHAEAVSDEEGVVVTGKVFMTSAEDFQPGLHNPSSNQAGVADFDPDDVPELTEGEKLASLNEESRQAIQRETVEDKWEKPQGSATRGISDDFATELKKHLR